MSERPWLLHYDKGVPHHIDYPDVPLFFFLEEAARKYPRIPVHHLSRGQDFIP